VNLLIASPLRSRWPKLQHQHPERYVARIKDLEEQEAEVWFAYVRAHRDHLKLDAQGRKGEAKQASKRARGLHRRHSKIMHQINFTTRYYLFNKIIRHETEAFDIMRRINKRPVAELATRRGSMTYQGGHSVG
jgi:hypothetical protein